eukprot:gnl/Trimastix_PCT/3834.p1 GENE.gnl/Trimastix_PCT/3834~~gnl/Trimastix_PCT/3834.p1  ORF type:complete len:439 (-),score=26.81 gnl/Trimastix_PCT/3834:71-1291(-)
MATNGIGSFWHFTDPHEDSKYQVNSDTDEACRRGSGSAGVFGDWECDMPRTLVDSTMQHMRTTQPNPDFVLMTGDFIAHHQEYSSHEERLQFYRNISSSMKQYFPRTPCYAVLGNNDIPDESLLVGPNWFYESLGNLWSELGFLDSIAAKQFRQTGYYSMSIRRGLRLVAMNSQLYMSRYELTGSDPAGQMEWLRNTLDEARSNNERVLLAYHVPPGFHERSSKPQYHHRYVVPLLSIYRQYSDIIVGHIAGHSHSDTFKLLSDQSFNDHPFGVCLVSPGPCARCHNKPIKCNNPSVRLFTYSQHNGTLLDYIQYWTDLQVDNWFGRAQWVKEYQFSEMYGHSEITPYTMHETYKRLREDDRLFEKYYTREKVQVDHGECTGKCRMARLCAMRYVDRDEFERCLMY